jgi:predicted TIM-barrel fold metal-dependent hydrolase
MHKIIDVRCRLTTVEAGNYFRDRLKRRGRYDAIEAFADGGTAEGYFKEIGGYGITTAVSVSGQSPDLTIGGRPQGARTTSNDDMAKFQNEHWGRFIGVAGIDVGNVLHDSMKELERSHKLGLRAVFIEPGRSPKCDLDDRRLWPFYERVQQLDMTLIPQTSGLWGGMSIDFANPRHLEPIAEDFPDLRILAGHACYPFVREAIIVAARHPNIWLSPDMYLIQMGTDDWVKSVNGNFFGLQDQFLFGTGYPAIPLKPYIDEFWKLPWKPDVLPKILYKNALRCFKLEDDPKFKAMYP